MNEDFTSLNPDEIKEGSAETVRKPIRRARRTVAPFIEKSALDVSEETKAEEVTVSEEILNQETERIYGRYSLPSTIPNGVHREHR